jgi:arylsulfatase A-like enzyme
VHFQTTDIHEPFNPVAPFSGIYVSPEMQKSYRKWDPLLYPGGGWSDPEAYKKHGIDRVEYALVQQGLYDEAMAHNDYQIGRLVERLRKAGEWEDTLLIIAADHGYPAACHRLMDPLPPNWAPMFNAHETRIPLIFVWPRRIAGGRRYSDPVSMVDVLPTVLDLAGLPLPDVVQGQSLAPLLLDEEGWSAGPVVLEEVIVDRETGDLRGLIEVVDGRWGASLEINPGGEDVIGGVGIELPDQPRRPAPLLLYDLWKDPYALHSLHEERPDLVKKYPAFLEERWQAHLSLAQRFPRPERLRLTQDQLDALQTLGYVQ